MKKPESLEAVHTHTHTTNYIITNENLEKSLVGFLYLKNM